MDRVYYGLGVSYMGWKKPDQAIPFLTKLVTDYPKSKRAAKGQKLLAEARKPQPAPAAPAKPPAKK
jgi:outer membrane protein assembly factor BamD